MKTSNIGKANFGELCDSKLSGLRSFDNMAISMSQKEVKIGKTGCFHKTYLHRYFFLQMIYTASQNIIYKQYRKKKLQNNTVPTSIKAC